MSVVLPALAAADLDGVLVGNRRGRVVHVALAPRGLTPTGRLRRDAAPVCGQRARSWRQWPIDGRPLCSRCARQCRTLIPSGLSRTTLGRLLADTLATCRDVQTLSAARLAVCSTSTGLLVDGEPLHRHVARAADRLLPNRPSHSAFPATTVRGRSRRALAHDRFAALVDLPGGTS